MQCKVKIAKFGRLSQDSASVRSCEATGDRRCEATEEGSKTKGGGISRPLNQTLKILT